MDRVAWRATIHGVAGVRHDLATKPPPQYATVLHNPRLVECADVEPWIWRTNCKIIHLTVEESTCTAWAIQGSTV